MYIWQHFRTVEGKRKSLLGFGRIVSYRARSKATGGYVAWLHWDESGRGGCASSCQRAIWFYKRAGHLRQLSLFENEDQEAELYGFESTPGCVELRTVKLFGGPWLAIKLIEMLSSMSFIYKHQPVGREQVPWSLTSMTLVIARLLDPSSELYISGSGTPRLLYRSC